MSRSFNDQKSVGSPWSAHQEKLAQAGPVLLLWCLSESSKEEFASTSIADELVRLFQKQTEHEKKEMIFEVLAPLAENGEMIV